MKGYFANIEKETLANTDFRRVLYTAKNCQLVLMSLAPGEEIGEEMHALDQFIRIEAGRGTSVLNGVEQVLEGGSALLVPAGVRHNIINASSADPLKLYTLYAPPNHIDGTVHKTKADAVADEEHDHFDGKTTE